MTIDEFFDAIKAAKPAEREALADRLIKDLSEDEKILAASRVGEFIAALGSGGEIVNAPPGFRLD
jgi:hypothetical protein